MSEGNGELNNDIKNMSPFFIRKLLQGCTCMYTSNSNNNNAHLFGKIDSLLLFSYWRTKQINIFNLRIRLFVTMGVLDLRLNVDICRMDCHSPTLLANLFGKIYLLGTTRVNWVPVLKSGTPVESCFLVAGRTAEAILFLKKNDFSQLFKNADPEDIYDFDILYYMTILILYIVGWDSKLFISRIF